MHRKLIFLHFLFLQKTKILEALTHLFQEAHYLNVQHYWCPNDNQTTMHLNIFFKDVIFKHFVKSKSPWLTLFKVIKTLHSWLVTNMSISFLSKRKGFGKSRIREKHNGAISRARTVERCISNYSFEGLE